MNKRVLELVELQLAKAGPKGRVKAFAALASKLNIGTTTLHRWMATGFQDATQSYKTALACGCSEAEALEIFKECLHKATG